MRTFNFYEFASVLVPGVIVLVAIGVLWPQAPLLEHLLPTAFGASLVHLVGAFGIGNMVQGAGKLFERAYWRPWGHIAEGERRFSLPLKPIASNSLVLLPLYRTYMSGGKSIGEPEADPSRRAMEIVSRHSMHCTECIGL